MSEHYERLFHQPLKQHTHDHHHHDYDHDHGHDHSHHHHHHGGENKKLLKISFVITFVVMFVEIIGGVYANSLALISDAIHMFTHSFALGLSLFAIVLAARDRDDRKTFGYFRAEILAAFINGLTIALSVLWIVYEAVIRFINPEEILTTATLIVALVGLVVNLLTGYILHKGDMDNINMKSAFFHMLADAFSSVAIIIGAVVIQYTNLYIIDTILALLVAVIIAKWAYGLLKDSVHILLEGSPIDTALLSEGIRESSKNVVDIHDIHCWEITNNYYHLSAHVAVANLDESSYAQTLEDISNLLRERFGIGHVTLQLEKSSL